MSGFVSLENVSLTYGGAGGTLGPALPMAIGAKVGAPERPVMSLSGDGGFLFTIQELATAVDLGLPLAIADQFTHRRHFLQRRVSGECADEQRFDDRFRSA